MSLSRDLCRRMLHPRSKSVLALSWLNGSTSFCPRMQTAFGPIIASMLVGKEWVEDGGLMSYGDRLPERYRRAADLVDKVLRGTMH